jgi:formamidopyrimidine-DNA glycosylase
MPELPDLLYIQKYLTSEVSRKTITGVSIKQSIVLRVAVDQPFKQATTGKTIEAITVHGPFIRIGLSGSLDLIVNLMLAGKLQHQRLKEKTQGHLCLSLCLDDGSLLNLCDEQQMAKAYLVRFGHYAQIPKYSQQGVDILSSAFTREVFAHLAAKHSRKQVRVFINDHTILSAIGNAYADEILFDAKIHPKTFVSKLSARELDTLYASVTSVIEWGIKHVEAAHQPIHVKVRDHMRVRNHRGEPCPRCGTTIRREGVRGYDVFYCPQCQPPSRKPFIDWKT